MLNLDALKEALAPLALIGRDELTFQTGGMDLTVRPLLPMEEVAVQRYAASVLDKIQTDEGLNPTDQMSRAAALDYFDRFRIEIIAYALVQVDSLDLREVTTIPTGETLENGTPVQMSRTRAMREVVYGWSRAMITVCFAKYGDLVQKIAEEADKIASSSIADIDSEIERVEERLESLKSDRDTRAKGDPSVTSKQITDLIRAGDELKEGAQRAASLARAQNLAAQAQAGASQAPQPEPPAQEAAPRQPVTPPSSPPPTTTGWAAPQPTHVPGEFQSSFEDGEDPEVTAAEEARIMAARREAMAARQQEESRDPLSRATPAGTVDGVEAYRLPAEEVSPRGKAKPQSPRSSGKATVDPEAQGTDNPHYKPRR